MASFASDVVRGTSFDSIAVIPARHGFCWSDDRVSFHPNSYLVFSKSVDSALSS